MVVWNRAAAALLTDYTQLPREQRNILRLMSTNEKSRSRNEDWDSVARFVVGTFRADMARAGAHGSAEATKLVAELSRLSPVSQALWQDNDVGAHGEEVKRMRHPEAGPVKLKFFSFAVEGRPELAMIVYNPANKADAERVRALVETAES